MHVTCEWQLFFWVTTCISEEKLITTVKIYLTISTVIFYFILNVWIDSLFSMLQWTFWRNVHCSWCSEKCQKNVYVPFLLEIQMVFNAWSLETKTVEEDCRKEIKLWKLCSMILVTNVFHWFNYCTRASNVMIFRYRILRKMLINLLKVKARYSNILT